MVIQIKPYSSLKYVHHFKLYFKGGYWTEPGTLTSSTAWFASLNRMENLEKRFS